MARRKEYIPVRYDEGTEDRVEALTDYIGAECLRKKKRPADVTRSEALRELVNFSLDVFERRAEVWRREQDDL